MLQKKSFSFQLKSNRNPNCYIRQSMFIFRTFLNLQIFLISNLTDSESGDDVPSSQAYNPSTAPSHEELEQQMKVEGEKEETNEDIFTSINGGGGNSMSGMTSFLDASASTILGLQTPEKKGIFI